MPFNKRLLYFSPNDLTWPRNTSSAFAFQRFKPKPKFSFNKKMSLAQHLLTFFILLLPYPTSAGSMVCNFSSYSHWSLPWLYWLPLLHYLATLTGFRKKKKKKSSSSNPYVPALSLTQKSNKHFLHQKQREFISVGPCQQSRISLIAGVQGQFLGSVKAAQLRWQ